MTNLFAGISFSYQIPIPAEGVALNWSGEIAAFLLGITFVIIGFVIFAYALAIMSVGQTISYVIIYKKKEGENLLERKSEEEELDIESREEKKAEIQTELPVGKERKES